VFFNNSLVNLVLLACVGKFCQQKQHNWKVKDHNTTEKHGANYGLSVDGKSFKGLSRLVNMQTKWSLKYRFDGF